MNTNKGKPASTPCSYNVSRQADIEEALKQINADQKINESAGYQSRRSLLWVYLVAMLAFAIGYHLLKLGLLSNVESYLPLAQQFSLVGFLITALLLTGEFLTSYWVPKISDAPSRYNLTRLIRLLVSLAMFITVVSIIFANWTTGLVSLGILSIILGLALQAPLSNLFAWFYILVRQPYRVGDRVRINDATGDVIDVGYFDTTLWEFGGQYLSTDHPSGRIIKFPNSLVLNQAVYNYSWPLFPYIWNEVKVYVAYNSDLDFVAETMHQAAMAEIGEEMAAHIDEYRTLLAQTPVDEIEVNQKPVVLFRAHENTWIEAVVRYLVEPKQAGPVKARILRQCLIRLNAEPDRVLLPRGDAR